MAIITNGTATSSAADALAAGHEYLACYIHAEGVALRFMIGADATSSVGEVIPADGSAYVNNLNGKRLSVYSASSTPYSVREAL